MVFSFSEYAIDDKLSRLRWIPMHREASIEIQASPEVVYDLVSNLPRMGDWSPENIGGEWQGGGSGQVGDRFLGHNRARRARMVGAGDGHCGRAWPVL